MIDETISRRRMSAEAAEWFATMQASKVSAAERARFSEWLSQSAEHINEYLQLTSLWRDLGETRTPAAEIDRMIATARRGGAEDKVVKFHGGGKAGLKRGVPVYQALAASVALVAIAAVIWLVFAGGVNGRTYTTDTGEQTTFSLPDGSVVRLNTRSELQVRMLSNERRIQLVRGEAMFEVAKDPQRPFRVVVGDATVQAVGTVFNVRKRDTQATVTVLEGRVVIGENKAVTAAEKHRRLDRLPLLQAREQARISERGAVVMRTAANLEQVAAWKDRRLVFNGETLAQIVDEFNRYNHTELRIDGPELAAIRISAIFGSTDPDSLIEFLKRTEEVSVRRSGDALTLYRE